MAKIEEKKPVVQEISEKIEGAASVVLVDHRGLTVAQDTELRKQLVRLAYSTRSTRTP